MTKPLRAVASVALATFVLAGSTGSLSSAVAPPPPAPPPVVEPVGLGAAQLFLTQLQTTLSSLINSGDLAASNRIKQAAVEVQTILKQIDEIKKGLVKDVNRATTEVFSSTQSLLVALRSEIRSTERRIFLDLNSTLVNGARLLDGIPFVNMQPFVIGAEPTRFSPDSVDREVFIYGYFKFVTDSSPAYVTVGDAKDAIPLKRYTNNRLGFTLPLKTLQAESYVNLKMVIPDEPALAGWWKRSVTLYDRIYIEQRVPYSFRVRATVPNPDLWEVVKPGVEIHENADSNRTSNDQLITAPQAFSRVVPDAVKKYVIESATFHDIPHRFGEGGPCEHVTRGATLVEKNKDRIHFRLHASSMSSHWPTVTTHHGGGGSHADIWFTPSFLVKKANVPEGVGRTLPVLTSTHADVKHFDFPEGWLSVEIVAQYKDGDEQFTETMVLSPSTPTGTKLFWDAAMNDKRLSITARRGPVPSKS
jgi:hypothetical protein